jgi:hypothetical protein
VNLQLRRCEPALVAQQRCRAALIRLLAPICAARTQAAAKHLPRSTCDETLAAKRVQRPGQSNSRLQESEHAMLKINIPQHSRGGMIAAERAVSPGKPIDFRVIGLKLAFSRRTGTPIPKLKPSASQSLKNVSFCCPNVNKL